MFGFLKGDPQDQEYRQVYAGCCSAQHRTKGIASLLFHSYEAIFLYLLAIDSKAVPRPQAGQVTCCRLRRGGRGIMEVDTPLSSYCSSFALLLAQVKLADDVADDRSVAARLMQWKLSPRIAESVDYLEQQYPGLKARIDDCLADHASMEASATAIDLDQYVVPTAKAFAEVFHGFQQLLPLSHSPAEHRFREIGQAIGAAIIAFDCAVDWRRDRQRQRFNPLRSAAEVQSALTTCQRHLAQAGWLCDRSFGEEALSTRTLGHVFNRVSMHVERLKREVPRVGVWQRLKGHGRRQLRYGFCDCDCPGCDCPIDGDCCDVDGTWCGDACCFCDCCIAPCDDGKKKRKAKVGDGQQLVGKVGVAVGDLDPEGVVMIGSERYPARSTDGKIEELTSIEVVGQDSFGVLVQRATLKEKKYGL